MKVEVDLGNLPEGITILQGYFVWSGIDGEGRRASGGIEYPYHEDKAQHDYDPLKCVGMLRFAEKMLLQGELDAHDYGDAIDEAEED